MVLRTVLLALCLGMAAAFTQPRLPTMTPRSASKTVTMETKADLVALAEKANPKIKYFDPLQLGSQSLWGTSEEATIGFLRHAEIKHGRIAMFAFVGFIAQSNGFTWPWAMEFDGTPFPTADGVPGAQWDAISMAAKLQILGFIAILEFWDEGVGKHYMKGGKPGAFPSFKNSETKLPHPVPFDLFDPFNFTKKKTEEQKAAGLVKEINNGRLAMIGIFSFLAESKIPGSVPALSGIIKPYSGDYMAPFESAFHIF